MEKFRAFIAVSIPTDVCRRLAEIEKQLSASGADVKWVAEGNFHVTMKFLGDVDSNRIEELTEAICSAVQDMPPFEVALSGVGAFPNTRQPNVVWVGTSTGGDELKAIVERLDSSLECLGFAKEAKPFSPHITVGRTKTPRNFGQLREAIERLNDIQAGSFLVEEVALMKSDLRPSGQVYTKIAGCEL